MREQIGTSCSNLPRGLTVAGDRAGARRTLLALRAGIAPAQRVAADEAIAARLDAIVRALAPEVVGGYWPMRDEPELVAAFTRWHAAGIAVALPRVVAAGVALEFGRWEPGAALVQGPFRTLHPEPHRPVVPQLLVLPCVGFDRHCFRLGYGGGYYDRTLAAIPGARAVGVGYDECEIAEFPCEPHDRRLDWIVTQTRVLRPA